MKRMKLTVLTLLMFFALGYASQVIAQDLYYDLKIKNSVKTTPSKDIQRINSCWSNAGAALIEAEMLKNGKAPVNLAPLDFVHNAYLLKADAYIKSKGKTNVTEKCLPGDVFKLMKKYGMVPQSAYIEPEKDPMQKQSGEMDAILRGTLRMAFQQDNGVFTERWKNTYETALMRYLGYAKTNFDYEGKSYTARTFAEESGVNPSDYIMLTSDVTKDYY